MRYFIQLIQFIRNYCRQQISKLTTSKREIHSLAQLEFDIETRDDYFHSCGRW